MLQLPIISHSLQALENGFALVSLTVAPQPLPFSISEDSSSDWKLQLLAFDYFIGEEKLGLFAAEGNEKELTLQLLCAHPESISSFQSLSCQPLDASKFDGLVENALLQGFGINIGKVFFLAKIRQAHKCSTQALLHSKSDFPFAIKPARAIWEEMPSHAIGASVLLEDWGVRNRLASEEFVPGCADMQAQEWQEVALNFCAENNLSLIVFD